MNALGLRFKKIWFTACLFILGTGFLTSVNALEIRIKDQAMVQDDTIYLRDIASFDPMGDSRVSRLMGVEISTAPPPGKMFRINDRFLIRKLDSAIATMERNHDIRFKVPNTLLVQRTAQILRSTRLKEIFKEHVFSHSPWPANKITFEKINDPGNVSLPVGRLQWEVRERQNHQYIGNMSITVHLLVDGVLLRKVPVSGRIRIKQDILKAAKKIESGQIISQSDLVLVSESQLRLNKHAMTNMNEVIGKRSVRHIQSGQMITSRMIESPPLVEKGSRVMIRAENKEIKIVTLGKVLEDGQVGEQVRVVNISSGKEIFATVAGPGLVEVGF